jgi:uncharacterized Tic20 family protein
MIQPPENLTEGTRRLAMLVHCSSLLGCVIPVLGHLLPPAVLWLLSRSSDSFVEEHARESLNFQSLAALSLGLGSILLLQVVRSGLSLGLLFAAYYAVTAAGSLLAAAQVRNGQPFAYPLPFRIFR